MGGGFLPRRGSTGPEEQGVTEKGRGGNAYLEQEPPTDDGGAAGAAAGEAALLRSHEQFLESSRVCR